VNQTAAAPPPKRHRLPGFHAGCRRAPDSFGKRGSAWPSEVFHALKETLKEKKLGHGGWATRGGFAPALGSNTAALDFLMQGPSSAPATVPATDIALALDVAASEFAQDNGRYRLPVRASPSTATN